MKDNEWVDAGTGWHEDPWWRRLADWWKAYWRS